MIFLPGPSQGAAEAYGVAGYPAEHPRGQLSGALIEAPEELGSWVRILAMVLLPIGPAAIGVLRFVLPYYTVDEPAAMASKVAVNLGAQSMVIWLGLIGALTIVPAVIWIGRLTLRAAPG